MIDEKRRGEIAVLLLDNDFAKNKWVLKPFRDLTLIDMVNGAQDMNTTYDELLAFVQDRLKIKIMDAKQKEKMLIAMMVASAKEEEFSLSKTTVEETGIFSNLPEISHEEAESFLRFIEEEAKKE